MPESNSQHKQGNKIFVVDCELSYKDNAWKQFTTDPDVTMKGEKLWIIL